MQAPIKFLSDLTRTKEAPKTVNLHIYTVYSIYYLQICLVRLTFLGDSSRRRRLDAEICAKEEVDGGGEVEGDVDGDALGVEGDAEVDEAGKLCQHLVFRVRQKFTISNFQ